MQEQVPAGGPCPTSMCVDCPVAVWRGEPCRVSLATWPEHAVDWAAGAAVSDPTGRRGQSEWAAVTPHWAQVRLSRLTGHRLHRGRQRSATLQAEVDSLSGQRSRLTERRYGCHASLGTDYIGDGSGQRRYRPKWTVWVGSGHVSLSAGTAVTPHWAQIHRGRQRSATLQAEVDSLSHASLSAGTAVTPHWAQIT